MTAPATYLPVDALRYVTTPEAADYRAIIDAFARARHCYRIQLRPTDVRLLLDEAGYQIAGVEIFNARLEALRKWGNLAASHDDSAAERLDEYYLKQMLYRLTPVGEAAHAAVEMVERAAERTGALQATMLDKIIVALESLDGMDITAAAPDALKAALDTLHAAFESLTTEASRFIGDLRAQLGAEGLGPEGFVLRKHALVTYLQNFVRRLSWLADPIRRKIQALTPRLDALVTAAKASGDLPPAMGDRSPADIWADEQRQKWAGVVTWFASSSGESTEQALMRVAEQSVSQLVHALHRLRDRVTLRVDRVADFRQLARWFGECRSDEAAHSLFARAFGLQSARHFHLEDDDERATPKTSWWVAAPVSVPVHLRRRVTLPSVGRTGLVADLSERRNWLRALRVQRDAERRTAVAVLGGAAIPRRASDLGCLESAAFALFRELLGAALAAPKESNGSRVGESDDGRVRMHYWVVEDTAPVVVETTDGRFRLPRDIEFTIEWVRN